MSNTTDLVKRLRDWSDGPGTDDLCQEAADALEAQAAHIEALLAETKQLRHVAEAARVYYDHYMQDEAESPEDCVCGIEQHRRALAVRDGLRALQTIDALSGKAVTP